MCPCYFVADMVNSFCGKNSYSVLFAPFLHSSGLQFYAKSDCHNSPINGWMKIFCSSQRITKERTNSVISYSILSLGRKGDCCDHSLELLARMLRVQCNLQQRQQWKGKHSGWWRSECREWMRVMANCFPSSNFVMEFWVLFIRKYIKIYFVYDSERRWSNIKLHIFLCEWLLCLEVNPFSCIWVWLMTICNFKKK